MENKSAKSQDGRWLADMPVQSENIAFKPDELIACTKCGKSNPPNRASCLYCATPIELREDRRRQAKLNLRPLENWEKGFNIVFVPPADEPDAASISRYLAIDVQMLQPMLAAARPIPIARIESEAEANIAVQQLANFGLNASVVSDEMLQADKAPTRLREIEFRDDSIVVISFNTGEKREIGHGDLMLIVTGSVVESKTESVEKQKKKETKLLHEMETTSDERLIDVYCAGDALGYRIPAKGFDFSCLGAEKGLLAQPNMERLKEKLLDFVPAVRLVDEYSAIMGPLSAVWEIERQKDFHGLTRTGIGKAGFANVARTSNLTQFTKYSRLQRHLL